MPLTSLPPTSGATPVTSAYAVFPMNATSNGPPPAMTLVGRPLANVVTTPDWGSTRATRPAAASATYSARSGPTALPKLPSRPEASSTAVGGPELLAASGPSPARSSPEGGAVVWSQPAIKTPTPIATSPLEIELQSMLDFNDIIPPGLTAVMATAFSVLEERNHAPKRLTGGGLPDVWPAPMLESPSRPRDVSQPSNRRSRAS